jgi:hypothetical protein
MKLINFEYSLLFCQVSHMILQLSILDFAYVFMACVQIFSRGL